MTTYSAYVSDLVDGVVSVVDVESQTVDGSPIGVGAAPVGDASTPDGSKVFVANNGDNTVSVIDTSTNTVIGSPISVGNGPSCIAVTPDGTQALVTTQLDNTVTVIDVGTLLVTDTITGFGTDEGAFGIAITPDGTTAYITDFNAGTVYVVDIGTFAVTSTITVGTSLFGVCFTPDGMTAYVADNAGVVWPITVSTGLPGIPITVGSGPSGICITPDGSTLYCCNFNDGTVSVIDVGSATVTDTVTVGPSPWLPAVTPDGVSVCVPVSGETFGELVTIAVSDNSTNTVNLVSGGQPFGVTISAASTPSIDLEVTTFVLAGDPGPTGYSAAIAETIELEVTTLVLAGAPNSSGFSSYLAPVPPAPVPGPFGNHEYEVVVCDLYGVAFGVIPTAVPTQIDYVLDDIGQTLIDFSITDPQAASLLPMSSIPGVREIQIWRDQVCIFWGWVTAVTWDSTLVHLTVSNLLWPFGQREVGPEILHYGTNFSFEQGLDSWTAEGPVTATPVSNPVVLGEGAARLVCATDEQEAYLWQDVVIDLTGQGGIAFALSAYVYIDANYIFTGPAYVSRGLYAQDQDGNILGVVTLDDTVPENTWTRMELQPVGDTSPAIIAPADTITTIQVRLYCPGGSVVWDDVILKAYENVSSPPSSPPATAWDVWDIIKILVETAQQPFWGKSDLGIIPNGSLTGVLLNRVYYTADSEVYLDALNEFPTDGYIDFEIVWDETGHFRYFRGFAPAKGSIKYNYPIDISDPTTTTDLEGAIDATQMGTTQRVFGQGSSGPARDAGYAQFASYLGGRVLTTAILVQGQQNIVVAGAAFTDADLGVNVYSLNGGLSPSAYILDVLSSNEITVSSPALLSLTGETFGIGGVVLDASQSALPNQPVGTLAAFAKSFLVAEMTTLVQPSAKMRADGPAGLFGLIEVGDVVPVLGNYGWVNFPPTLMRIQKLSLYPPTEELQPTFQPVNALPSLT